MSPQGKIQTGQIIFVVVRTDIASDVRISAGGGEIGYTTLESAHYTQAEAQRWVRAYYEDSRQAISEEPGNEMNSEELDDYMENIYSWDVKEVVLHP